MTIAKIKESMFCCSSKNGEVWHSADFFFRKGSCFSEKLSVKSRTRSRSWYSRFQLSSVWIRSHLHSGREIWIYEIQIYLMGSLHPMEKEDAYRLLLYRVLQVQLMIHHAPVLIINYSVLYNSLSKPLIYVVRCLLYIWLQYGQKDRELLFCKVKEKANILKSWACTSGNSVKHIQIKKKKKVKVNLHEQMENLIKNRGWRWILRIFQDQVAWKKREKTLSG